MFEIELFVCIKMDLALINQRMLIYSKTRINKQTIVSPYRMPTEPDHSFNHPSYKGIHIAWEILDLGRRDTDIHQR